MFKKVLIANRGEIALRVIVACRELGIKTVAVYSEADENSLHVRFADEDVCIGPPRSSESYLNVPAIISAAEITGADAIHPGYGFLSESAYLAEVCEACHIRFIGPDPNVIKLMGDKARARRAMKKAGVPMLPGSDGPLDSEEKALKTAKDIGYPVIIKAVAGGGGRGMRVVRSPDDLADAVEAARREALAGFGDETVFFERYIERPRHVEVQLLADSHGAAIHLGERECSIQRRHQKVLEESPSPALDVALRAEITAAAVAIARELGYQGAGTAEFMVDGGRFYFLELNARIQVEHPVTELVTGVDVVEQQLRVAAGEPLALATTEPEGHAVEVRLYAEHPLSFLPQAGRVESLALPEGIRVDAGIEAGDEVPIAYDPMIAKLIAQGETREKAPDELARALDEARVAGVRTNLPFLRWLVRHPEVRAGRTTTAFLTEHPPLSRYPRVPRVWRGWWRLNADHSFAPSPQPPPLVEATAHGPAAAGDAERTVVAPMPGTVIRVLAGAGERVEARQPLVVIEAMKMETPLASPFDAVVRRVAVAEGDRVSGGDVLIELEA
jgi:acetyl-CoA carboxylase, biotin carboxylase subunit